MYQMACGILFSDHVIKPAPCSGVQPLDQQEVPAAHLFT